LKNKLKELKWLKNRFFYLNIKKKAFNIYFFML
jgi:hypothetical protein